MSGFSGLNPLPVANGGTGGTTSTGSGAVVLASSPSLTTPALGAATVTSVNGLAITSSTGALTIFNGKTLTAQNTLTLAGSDSTTIQFQGTDTYVGRTTTDTLTNKTISGSSNTLTVLAGSQLSGTVPVANGGTGDTGTSWTTYTPSCSVSQSTGTVVASATGRYKTIGKTVFLQVTVTISGTFTAGLLNSMSLPVIATSSTGTWLFAGKETGNTGVSWNGGVFSTATSILIPANYLGSTTVVTGNVINLSGVYEAA